MKKKIHILFCFLLLTVSVFSQMHKESWQKIKALKIAYLTEQLALTTKEAEKFWPIYNTFDVKQRKLRNSSRFEMKKLLKQKGSIDAISDDEAKTLIALKLQNDKALYELQSDFINKVNKIISYKKIMKLQLAEMEFARKLMRKYRKNKP